MHSLEVDVSCAVVERRADVCNRVTGRESCSLDGGRYLSVGRRRGDFAPVDCGVRPQHGRPHVRRGSRLAGEVPGVDSSRAASIVEIEREERHNTLVGVDLDELKDIDAECLGFLVPAQNPA